jgi:3-oxoacyl-[acyl-carrier-protein] synthase II
MSDSNGRRRVVVTGMGAVTPLGNSADESWSNLIAGKSGAGPITLFDNAEYPTKIACELKGFDPEEWIDRKAARRMDRFAQMVLAAARQAETDSGLDVAAEAERIGASIATGIGGLGAFQDCHTTLIERGPERVGPFSIPAIIPNMGAAWVSMELGTRGPLTSQCTACAASNMAIGEALDAIRLGRADHPRRHRRLRRDASALTAQRRARARLPSVRRRPRRVRDGRGRRGARPRGARARTGARREDLRGAARLRRLV